MEQKIKKQKKASGLGYCLYKACPNTKANQGCSLGEPWKDCHLMCEQNLTNEDRR